MAIEVKFRRGTDSQHNSFTGANGEITVDTTNKTLRVHDGVTVGGTRLAKYSEVSNPFSNVTSHIIPSANVTYDLGSPGKRWRSLYLSNNTIYLDSVRITSSPTGVKLLDANSKPVPLRVSQVVVTNTSISTTIPKATITDLVLTNVLGTQYGGTGKSSLTQNGVMYASNSTAFSFATGTNGKVMQIGSNGVPKFDDVDGGSFP